MKYIYTLLTTFIFIHCTAQNLVPFHTDTLWGYRTREGVVKIEPQYRYASKFWNGIALVVKNEKAGVIDSNNTLIMPFHYEFLQPLDSAEFLFGYRAKYFGEHIMGVITRDGKIKIPAEYSYITKYKGVYNVMIRKDSVLEKSAIGDVRSMRQLHGLMDSNGKLLIACKYDYINWLNDTLLVLDISHPTPDGLFRETTSALFNKRGEQLTTFDFKVIGKFENGVSSVRIGDKWGYIYPSGKVAIPIQYDGYGDYNKGYAIMQQDKKWGVFDSTGKIVIEPTLEYQEVKNILKEKYGW